MKKKMIFVGAMLVVTQTAFAQQQETEIEEISISSKVKEPVYKSGKNVTLLTSKDLENYKGQNLTDVLNRISGFQISGNFNNTSEPKGMKIRGGKSANILILVDGIPLKDVTGNDYTLSDIRLLALENVESIEVLNGASSVLYGSNATVSVINITTKKNSTKRIEGQVGVRAGSFDTYAQNAGIKGKLNKFSYQFNGFNEKSEGISSASGQDFEKDGWEKQNINAGIGFASGKFDAQISSGYNHHYFHYDSGAFLDGTFRNHDEQFQVSGNANFTTEEGKTTFNSRYSTTERKTQDLVGSSYQDFYLYQGQNLFLEAFHHQKINEYFNFIGGIQYENQSLDYSEKPFDGEVLEEKLNRDDTNYHNFDAFLKANFQYQIFNLQAGARYTDHSKFGNHFVYNVNPFILKEFNTRYLKVGYSFATAFIAPTLYQNFGQLPWVLSNFDLKPETNESQEIDLSFGEKNQKWVINATLFQRKEKDVFVYQIVDFTTYAGQFQNIETNEVKGFEVGAEYEIHPKVRLGGNFSFVEKEKEETMLRQPKQRINSFVEILPFSSTRIFVSHQWTSKMQDSYYDMTTFSPVTLENEAYHLLNLNINQKINSKLSVYANVGNLFNESYVDIIGYTTKPRNYTFGVDYRF